ncbi:hypothetical protein KKI24_27005, partial [bacterium]|nr:hypothetical protein [bacterium]
MAKIIVGSYVVCYPVGGYLSWTLQWLIGFQRLGHDVYYVEKCGSWEYSCFDLLKGILGNDCSSGVAALSALLSRFNLKDKCCFVDASRNFHGLQRGDVTSIFKSADLFVDISGDLFFDLEDTWDIEALDSGLRVCVDGEPGYAQMRMEKKLAQGEELPAYDYYYTVGRNVGTEKSTSPTVDKLWRPTFDPIDIDLFQVKNIKNDAPFTTVMAWQSHKPVEFKGKTYGQKDVEFAKFMDLPQMSSVPLEISVAGKNVPNKQLNDYGWRVKDSHAVTVSFDSFRDYINASKGEFTVCKNVFVETNSGWFSDRS